MSSVNPHESQMSHRPQSAYETQGSHERQMPYNPEYNRVPGSRTSDFRHYGSRKPLYNPGSYTRPNAFVSALLSVLAFVFLCIFIFLLILRAGNIPFIIRNTEISEVLEEIEESYYFINQINGLPFHNVQVDFSDIDNFLRSDAVASGIGGVVSGYTSAIVSGNLDYYLTTDEVVGIARNLEPEFHDLFDHRMTEDNYEYLARTLDDIIDFRSWSVETLLTIADMDLTIPRLLFSPFLLWGVGLFCAFLLLVIFLRRKGSIADALLAVGGPILTAGIVCFAAGLLIAAFPEIFGYTFYNISRFLVAPVRLVMRYGLTFITIGASIILVSIVFRAIAPKTPRASRQSASR